MIGYHLVTFIFVAIILSFLYIFQRRFFWGISFSKRRFAGLIFLGSHFVFIVPGLFIILKERPNESWVIFVLDNINDAFFANLMIIFSLFLFALFSLILSYFFTSSWIYDGHKLALDSKLSRNYTHLRRLLFSLIISTLMVLTAIHLFTTVNHAIVGSILTGNAPGAVRHSNSASGLGGLLNLFLQIYTLLSAILLGIPNICRTKVGFGFAAIVIFYSSSLHGDKAPTIMAIVAWSITRLHFVERVRFSKVLLRILLLSVAMASFLLLMVSFYFGDISISASEYFSGRVLLGQMAGYYDQITLSVYNFSYIFHGIPFYSLFGEPLVFHRDLMLITENRFNADAIGVKNSFFIAEATAIFGLLGYIVGPAVMAYGSIGTYLALCYTFKYGFLISDNSSKAISSLFFCIYFQLTAGISELIFFKSLVLLLIVLTPPFLISKISRGLAT